MDRRKMNPSDVLQRIRYQVGEENLIKGNAFNKDGCRVDLSGIQHDRVVVDMDKVFPSGQDRVKSCDCVLFYFDSDATFVTVPIECTTAKSVDVSKEAMQLKAGASYAAQFAPPDAKNCIPILVYSGGLHKVEVDELSRQSTKVRFRGGVPADIRTTKCGIRRNITSVLAKAGSL